MILSFQKEYRYSVDGIHVSTHHVGNQVDIDPKGPMRAFLHGILEGGFAIEVKPSPVPLETTGNREDDTIHAGQEDDAPPSVPSEAKLAETAQAVPSPAPIRDPSKIETVVVHKKKGKKG